METKLTEKRPFEVKRGMVFFLNRPAEAQQPISCISEFTPEKKRPYLVISNDRCNSSCSLINVAPIFTRDPSPDRFYNVPFKSSGDRNCVVDVGQIILIPKNMCNEFTYSAEVSRCTMYNKNLFDGISAAIIKHFALDAEVVNPETAKIIENNPVHNTPIPNVDAVTKTVVPNIVLNISINGVPVSFDKDNVSYSTSDNQADVSVDVSNHAENKKPYETPEISTRENTVTEEETSSNDIAENEVSSDYIKNFVYDNFTGFSGTMTPAEMISALGVSPWRVYRYTKAKKIRRGYADENNEDVLNLIKKRYRAFGGNFTADNICFVTGYPKYIVIKMISNIKNEIGISDTNETIKEPVKNEVPEIKRGNIRYVSVKMTEKQEEEFMRDFDKYGVHYVLEKYKDLGFQTLQNVYRKRRTIRERRNKKTCKSVK